MSAIPDKLRGMLAALVLLAGAGTGALLVEEASVKEAQANEYVQAVAADASVSDAVKVAMVMGSYYESSGRHIGTPYIDKLGKGRPLTVCNGVTGAGVVAGRYYTPAECHALEKGRYIAAEAAAKRSIPRWTALGVFQQATFIDFIYNKGEGALKTSTMLRKLNAGDVAGACLENPRWNRGTVNGISTVLPGLDTRGKSNAELCSEWKARAL